MIQTITATLASYTHPEGGTVNITLDILFGGDAPPLREQVVRALIFPRTGPRSVAALQRSADAITRVHMDGLITARQALRMRAKLVDQIVWSARLRRPL